jgi:hypothetical protein
MAGDDNLDPPSRTKGDLTHSSIGAALSAIPSAGGAASALFSLVVMPPLEKRRREWMERVTEALRDLQGKIGLNLEELSANEEFIDCVLHASQVALRTSQKEKLEALQNAILNAASPNPPDQALQLMFLNFVDRFTEWHLRTLQLFHDPVQWFENSDKSPPGLISGGLFNILIGAYPELSERKEFYELIWKDLFTANLIRVESPNIGLSTEGMLGRITTEIGGQFIDFLAAPSIPGESSG